MKRPDRSGESGLKVSRIRQDASDYKANTKDARRLHANGFGRKLKAQFDGSVDVSQDRRAEQHAGVADIFHLALIPGAGPRAAVAQRHGYVITLGAG